MHCEGFPIGNWLAEEVKGSLSHIDYETHTIEHLHMSYTNPAILLAESHKLRSAAVQTNFCRQTANIQKLL